ncbi:hypothetical protein HJG60_008779 [Phyllostomus discolor]|uniref:Uncharacterized protein n=1 Tax=Phyllostomus discolor TaxID=89673 RepID=A0A834DFW4_9CHIR|nr:hypothetical protein HJG60_008779 [Phyllostomus discolor]
MAACAVHRVPGGQRPWTPICTCVAKALLMLWLPVRVHCGLWTDFFIKLSHLCLSGQRRTFRTFSYIPLMLCTNLFLPISIPLVPMSPYSSQPSGSFHITRSAAGSNSGGSLVSLIWVETKR